MKKKYIYILVLVLIVVAVVIVKHKSTKSDKEAPIQDKSILLNKADISTVANESINEVIAFTGELSAKQDTAISSEVDAKVSNVYVSEADYVKSGTLLAKLDTSDLSLAVLQQRAQVNAAKATYDINLLKYKRQRDLYESGFISKIAFDELASNSDSASENYKVQLEQLKRLDKQLSNTNITAPFDGVVYQKFITPGKLVSKNTKLFSIANLDILEIKAPINSVVISGVKIGDSVEFTVTDTHNTYMAKILRINNVTEDGTRSFMVYAGFDNKLAKLKAGQFISGQVILKSLALQNTIPCGFIRSNDANKSFVLGIESGLVKLFNVETLLRNSITDKCAVTNLSTDAVIISGNVLTVKSGDPVKVI